MSAVDRVYRNLMRSKFFVKGWGDPYFLQKIIENHKVVSKRETCKDFIKDYDIKLVNKNVNGSSTIIEGSFISPFSKILPGSMDDSNQVAKFQLIIPNKWTSAYRPLCIHYAGTGDHEFNRRRYVLANRLIKDGIASLIHMNPFYGARKPIDQRGSSLNHLFDLFVMGGALILEAQVMLRWATKHEFGPLAIHGISMGGHMACLGASVYPEPVCLIPCLSWTTASHVFTEGAMSPSVAWNVLSQQYHNDEIFSRYIRAAIEPPIPYDLQTPKQLSLTSNFDPLLTTKPEKSFHTLSGIVPFLNRNNSNQRITVDKDVLDFMRDLLDYFTHLGNYSVPVDTRLVTAVVAEKDAYIPLGGVAHISDVWGSNCEVEILKGRGHVGAYVQNSFWKGDKFREAIVRTLNRYIELYHDQRGPLGEKK